MLNDLLRFPIRGPAPTAGRLRMIAVPRVEATPRPLPPPKTTEVRDG